MRIWLQGLSTAGLLGLGAMAAIAHTGTVPVAGVDASSSRDAYFAAARVLDDSLTTAWAPAPGEAHPTLTLRLANTAPVTAMGLKLDPAGTAVDVAVLGPQGTWRTIATDLKPPSGTLTRLELPDVTTSQVRLTFHAPAGQLKVCDVRFYPGTAATPTPKPTPSVKPSPSPTAAPGDRRKVTGGGWLMSEGRKVSFGLTARDGRKGDRGNLQVVFHGKPTRQLHGRITDVSGSGDTVTLRGTLNGRSGGTFTAVVTDRGEPGRQDSIKFTTSTGLRAEGRLSGGNIQVHRVR